MQVSEFEERMRLTDRAVENLKVTENNHTINLENKIENIKYRLDNTTADADKMKNNFSEETRNTINELKMNLGILGLSLSHMVKKGSFYFFKIRFCCIVLAK